MRVPQAIGIGEVEAGVVALTPEQRSTHLHMIGTSGSGKTRLLAHMVTQDIQARHGVCVLDPTGNLYKFLVKWSAARGMHRRRTMHFFDPNSDSNFVGFNPLLRRDGEDIAKRASDAAAACARVWSEDLSNTPLLRRMLGMIFTALIEKDLTLVEATELMLQPPTEEDARIRSFLTRTDNELVRRMWDQLLREEAQRAKRGGEAEDLKSTINHMAEFLISDRMKRIFSGGEVPLDLRTIMDEGHCLIVNLQREQISDSNSRLLGTLIANELLVQARARDSDYGSAHPFYCYIDEAYQYLTEDIEQALDETRQKGLHYTLAHQRLKQLHDAGETIYGAVMGIRNKVVFGDLVENDPLPLAEAMFQAEYDENQVVEALRSPTVVRYDIRKNRQYRDTTNEGAAEGRALAEMRTEQFGSNTGLNLLTDPFGHITGNLLDSGAVMEGRARGKVRGRNEVASRSKGVTDGWAESPWPVLEDRPGAVRSYDEQMRIFAKRLTAAPERTVTLKLRKHRAHHITVPYVGDPITRDERIAPFLAAARDRSLFMSTTAHADLLYKKRRERLDGLASGSPVFEDFPEDAGDFFQDFDKGSNS